MADSPNMVHYHITVVSANHVIGPQVKLLAEDAETEFEKTIQLITDLSGSTLLSKSFAKAVFFSGDTVKWYLCTHDCMGKAADYVIKYDAPTVEDSLDAIFADSRLSNNEIFKEVDAQMHVDVKGLQDIAVIVAMAEALSVAVIGAIEAVTKIVVAIAETFQVFGRQLGYLYENVFSGTIHILRELKRVSVHTYKKKVLRLNSLTMDKSIDWHLPVRPCRKIYERYNVKLFRSQKRSR